MEELVLKVCFGREVFEICVDAEASVGALKLLIASKTNVLPHRQKLMGIKVRKYSEDDALSTLKLRNGQKIQVLGTPEKEVFVYDAEEEEDDVEFEEEDQAVFEKEENIRKLARRIESVKVEEMNPGRPGKKLLVLDVDYTLFDHRTPAESMNELRRPYLHEFLESAYEDFDIIIWSATSMKWVKLKMQQMGCLDEANVPYRLRFMLDESPMFTVESTRSNGKKRVVRVKPLQFIWERFEQYDSTNTIMFDDVRHNGLFSPQNFLRIRPFRNGPLNQDKDCELKGLAKYLKYISKMDDFSKLKHRHWEDFI